jgi:hypothetical protein
MDDDMDNDDDGDEDKYTVDVDAEDTIDGEDDSGFVLCSGEEEGRCAVEEDSAVGRVDTLFSWCFFGRAESAVDPWLSSRCCRLLACCSKLRSASCSMTS